MIARPSRWPSDLIAGLSTAGLLLPEAVAYAGLANLPVQAAVIALLVGLLTYGLFGSSRFAIVSATSSSAALLAASLGAMNMDVIAGDRLVLAAGLVIMTGILFLIGALCKVGDASAFIGIGPNLTSGASPSERQVWSPCLPSNL